MRPISADELKTIQLNVLQAVHDFCEKEQIRYSLSCGTLLGAVRHGGYIPWDDDIDKMMPRPDYERFCQTFPGAFSNYAIQNYHNDDTFWYNFGKVYDTRTILYEPGARCGVYVDIFILDGLPDNKEEISKLASTAGYLLWHDLRYATKEFKVKTNIKKKFLHFFKYQLRKHLVPKRLTTANKIDNLLKSHQFSSSPLAGLFFFDKILTVLNRQVYESYSSIKFEGRTFKSIADTDTWLKSQYGNYMKLPPVEQQVGRHNIKAYWL